MELQEKINNFNKKHKLNFSLDSLNRAIQKERIQTEKKGQTIFDDTISNKVFEDMVKAFYRENAKNSHLKETNCKNFEFTILEEFKSIVDDYKKTEQGELFVGRNTFLYFDKRHKAELIYESLTEFKENPVLGYSELYKEGRFPIRLMRERAENTLNSENPSKEGLAQGLLYARTLREVNASRSLIWKIIHPFRNHAEQKYANQFQADMEKVIARVAKGEGGKNLPEGALDAGIVSTSQIMDENTLEWCKAYNPIGKDLTRLEDDIIKWGGVIEGRNMEQEQQPLEDDLDEKIQIQVDLNEVSQSEVSSKVEYRENDDLINYQQK